MAAVQLPLAAPPELAETLGYHGQSRFVAFWWTPYGDELSWTDGQIWACGANWHAWLAFIRHPLVRAVLAVAADEAGREPFEFGSSDTEARDALLVDRWEGTLEAGPIPELEQVLRSQPSELAAVKEHYAISDEEMIAQLVAAHEAQVSRPADEILAEAQQRIEEDSVREQALAQWLDAEQCKYE